MTYTSPTLRALAEGRPCVNCNTEDGTTVLAHLPFFGIADHGMAEKCDDFWAAWLCRACHERADSAELRKDLFWRTVMVARTLRVLFKLGHLRVSKKAHY